MRLSELSHDPARNVDIAALLIRMSILLEIQGANPFRVRAYQNAARTLRGLPQSAADMLAEGKNLSALPHIGKDLAAKMAEIVETGRFGMLEQLEAELAAGLAELTELPGLGPKRVRTLYEELGVRSLTDLQRAATEQRIRTLHGFGPKTEQRIRDALIHRAQAGRRYKLSEVQDIAAAYVTSAGCEARRRISAARDRPSVSFAPWTVPPSTSWLTRPGGSSIDENLTSSTWSA